MMQASKLLMAVLLGLSAILSADARGQNGVPDEAWCAIGIENAVVCRDAAVRYFSGDRVDRDRGIATSLLVAACEGGLADACGLAGLIHEDRSVATDLFAAGCEGGDASACFSAGWDYASLRPFDENAPATASAFFLAACDAGHAVGCFESSFQFAHGIGVDADLARAEALFDETCALLAAAQAEEGIRFVNQWGVSLAITLVRACEHEFDPEFSMCGRGGRLQCLRAHLVGD